MRFSCSALDMPLHGHDAFAFSSTTLVVADGVGSWTDRDVDPAIWSHMLVSEVIMNQDADDDPDSILDNLFRAVARCRAPGSSTLVVAVMEPDGPHALLYNLGDSSWWQVRDSQIIARSRISCTDPTNRIRSAGTRTYP